jgi:uncharacterized protein (TIGR00369 family)
VGQITAEDINRFMREMFGTDADPVEDAGDGWAVARMIEGSEHIRPGGIISGPSVFALADGALAYACYTKIGLEPMALTSEMSIRYLRPAIGSQLRARAEVLSVGRRNVVGSVVLWTDSPERPVAVAQGTYVRPQDGAQATR